MVLTNYGVLKAIQFGDGMVGFEKKEALIDLDGDGLPDVGSKSGTTSADTLEGGEMDEKMSGGKGNDTLFGAKGADLLEGGEGDDILIGGTDENNSKDIVKFDGNIADYEFTKDSGKYIARKADGSYELNDDLSVKMYDKADLMDLGGVVELQKTNGFFFCRS